jgi:hypothetical protein
MKSLIVLALAASVTMGCATKNDLVINYGDGDSVRFVDAGDAFYCDDPAYEDKEKVVILTLGFADGLTKTLCELKSTTPNSASNPSPE